MRYNFLFNSKIGFALFIIISSAVFLSFYNSNNTEENKFPQNYRIITPPVPNKLTFCGEEVPLWNIDVRERLEREIIVATYWHSAMLLYLKRANRYFPVIKPILRKNGIPEDMIYLCAAESGLENVSSPAGAKGFWQFMKSAAKKYGLEVNGAIDERYNLKKATAAACKYLADSHKEYGTWTLAAASYNLGKNGVTNQLERQKEDNYYTLILNPETSRYVFRILALKVVMNNPKLYGFDIDESELYPRYETFEVKIHSEIKHAADFAKQYGLNYRILKLFNPWMRENYLPNKKNKEYVITLPTKKTLAWFLKKK